MVLSHPTGAPRGVGDGADVEVAVVGAGPHGLSAAEHLRRVGVRPYVLGEPMSFWQTMPEGMLLRSNLSATNMIECGGPLSLERFGHERGAPIAAPVPLEDFVAYGLWVQRRVAPDVDRRRVTALHRSSTAFTLELDDGETMRARRVVLACGIAPFARVPQEFAALAPDRVTHSSAHRDLSGFAGARVSIVGGGQSAFELAVLIKEAGARSVDVLVRSDRVVWLRGHGVKKRIGRLGPIVYAPTDVGPLWYSRLVERPRLLGCLPRRAQTRIAVRSVRPACSHFVRVRLDGVTIRTGVRVRDARAGRDGVDLSLSDGGRLEADHLILATGYEVDVRGYDFLAPELRGGLRLADGGFPVLGRGLESSVPGLHIMGAPAAWTFGPIMRFVSGSWYAGRAVASTIARRPEAIAAR
jgi:FAD-dependent urate hydroxylase